MAEPLHPQAPQQHETCEPADTAEKSCLDIRLALFLVSLAGAVILLLLYKLLQLRHRLSVARARQALEYCSFYHTATYTLKHPGPCQEAPVKNGAVTDATPPVLVMTPVPSPPALLLPSPPALPPPPIRPPPPVHPPPPALPPPPVHPPPPALPPPPVHPPPPALPPPPVRPSPPVRPPVPTLPVVYTTPPSPHPSLGACSDADVYSRIGAFRPSRLSSLSSHSTVILFEHSSL